jgi:tetratricopeptide (TPR) repeat protein
VNHDLLAVNFDQMKNDADAIREWDAARGLFDALIREQPDQTDYQMSQARVYSSLARSVGPTDPTRANDYYSRAIDIRRRLMADNPGVPQYANDFAASAANYASRMLDGDRIAPAESYARDALAIRERLVADFPAVSTYRCYLAHSLCVSGRLAQRRGRSEEALKLLTRGTESVAELYRQDPNRNLTVEIYGMCLSSRAALLDKLKKYADAATDWERAAKVGKRNDWAADAVLSLARSGDHEAALSAAKKIERANARLGNAAYPLARAFAVMAAKTTDADTKEQFTKTAVRYLREVMQAGRRSPNQIRDEPDFAGLRERTDFVEAIREVLPRPRPGDAQ